MTKLEIKTTWRALAGVLIIALLVAIAITYLLTYVSSNEGFILHMTALSIGYIVLILRWIIKYWPRKFVRFDQKGILIRKRSIFGKEEEHLYKNCSYFASKSYYYTTGTKIVSHPFMIPINTPSWIYNAY